ncbi:sulfite exporter TauE/SafE family protein [Streptococcus thoraltensis]|uniref:sulfite exporter TauE/SafE family protein n=1 Tax=Streptococcus thoraltensis TaxID=55085 RepID=UPI0003666426|nr:sulfite exporter TauE/SafE family protein [Streptococcus thoraltensis]MDY4760670.1 sulfite exporter TauE/SafE family protein [Streptococcus thoraltensis]
MADNIILHLIQFFLVIAIITIASYLIFYIKKNNIDPFKRFWTGFGIGLTTDLLDTLGIGSFATTTTLFKATKMIDDDSQLPGTMNAVHVIPVLIQSLCFILVVNVEPLTLVSMAGASFIGALFGTKITKNWHTPTVQGILGTLLIIAALISIYRMWSNPGADIVESAHGLEGIWLAVGIIFNLIIGVLMTMGLGNYAPELIFFSLMGLSPAVAMPVMMLDAAMIMTASTTQFVKNDRISWNGYAGMVLGGIVGVLIAVAFLSNLNLNSLKVLVVIIVLFTGSMLIRSSLKPQLKDKQARHH